MSIERKRHKKKKHHIDIMKPIIAADLGSENDPCFGKHYSIKADECKRCGDADVCAIISQTKLIKEIEEESTKSEYLDVQEAELVDSQNKKLETLLKNKAKKAPDKWLSLSKLIPTVTKKFNLTEKDNIQTLQRLIKAAERSKYIQLNKSLTKYKWNQ